jgi:hypothetical protein
MKRSYLLLAMVLQLQCLPVATFADTQHIDGIKNQSVEKKTVSHEKMYINGFYYNLYDQTKEAEVAKDDYSQDYVGDITIPSTVNYEGTTYNVTGIGVEAFWGMTKLTSIDIPNSVTSIGDRAFGKCGFTTLILPTSLTSIGTYAFENCNKLQSITIPKSVSYIGASPLIECAALKNIIVDKNNKTYNSGDNCNAIIHTATNELIQGCKNTVIPNTVTKICIEAFRGMTDLTSIDIPNSVTSIGDIAFGGCEKLTTFTIPNSITSIGYAAFAHCEKLQSITIPKSVTSIGQSPLSGCAGIKTIIVDKDNKVYDSRNNCNAIIETETNELIQGCQNTVIPNTVTRIADYAFYGMSGLTSIDIPNSVTNIGYCVFSNCGLTTLTIPNSVTYIGQSLVSGNTNLKSITLSESLKHIPEATFNRCDALESITIPESVESIEWGAFSDCKNLKSITFKSTTPPAADTGYFYLSLFNLFRTLVDNHVTIHVPTGYKEAYKATNNEAWNEVWSTFTIVDDGVNPQNSTGIDNVTTSITQQPTSIFDLSGKRQAKPQKGINIINGKKVIIK